MVSLAKCFIGIFCDLCQPSSSLSYISHSVLFCILCSSCKLFSSMAGWYVMLTSEKAISGTESEKKLLA